MIRVAPAALVATLLLAAPAQALEIRVTTQTDGIACDPPVICTLRGAVQLANQSPGPHTIVVPAGTYVLDPQFGQLIVDDTNVTITGAGARTTTVDARSQSQVFQIVGNATATIMRLTIQNGNAGDTFGGNVQNFGATVTLDQVQLTGGSASSGGGAANDGGGVMTINRSLLYNNQAPIGLGTGAALANRGSVGGPAATLTVTNTTIAGNRASTSGGALATAQGAANLTRLLNVTISGNSATLDGGGVSIDESGGAVQAQGSVIAGNTPSDCVQALTDQGANIESGTRCGFSRQNTNPMLGSLADHGGDTNVMPLLPGSPALDLQPVCTSGTDQRGVARPQGPACDAGAFERVPPFVGRPPPPPPPPANDADRDGVTDSADNCPQNANTDQADGDDDRVGDVCEVLPSGDIPPRAGVTATVQLVSGEVFVKLPPSAGASDWRTLRAPFQESGFVPLKGIASVPVRSVVDTRKGRIALRTAANSRPVGDRRRRLQAAQFAAGMFRIRQQRARRASSRRIATDAQLVSAPGAQRVCARRPGAGPPKGVVRRLSATGKGLFRTIGGASIGIARSATWITTDRCNGTLTEVGRGRVTVRAKTAVRRRGRARRRAVTVRAGRAYLVRARLFAVRKGRDRPAR